MKYTKISNKLGKVVLGIIYGFMILFILGVAGLFLWVDLIYRIPMVSLLWLVLLPTVGLGVNWFIGHFFGDKYYNTGMVHEGRSIYDVEKTPKYYSRRMFVCFIECFLFVLLIVRYILSLPLITSIIGIIGSVIAIIIYFIVGMSSYEQSSLKNKKKDKENSNTQN